MWWSPLPYPMTSYRLLHNLQYSTTSHGGISCLVGIFFFQKRKQWWQCTVILGTHSALWHTLHMCAAIFITHITEFAYKGGSYERCEIGYHVVMCIVQIETCRFWMRIIVICVRF